MKYNMKIILGVHPTIYKKEGKETNHFIFLYLKLNIVIENSGVIVKYLFLPIDESKKNDKFKMNLNYNIL